MSYQIITDSCCDFPTDQYAKLGLTMVPLTVEFRGKIFEDENGDILKDMYDGFRSGEAAKTSAVNPEQWTAVIEPTLAGGQDALVLVFSSGLSSTYQSAVIAAEGLREQYPDRKLYVVDTLCASMGQGLLVWYACRKRDEGMGLEDLRDWVEENKLHLCHWFTVDDLMYLKRGGRISAATALVGTMLQIKPVLHVDDEGHLVNVAKARGRKGSLDALVKKVAELDGGYDNSTMFVSHGDCLEDAQYVAQQVKEKYGVQEVVISYVGSVIGSHSGPGTVALFFLGKHR